MNAAIASAAATLAVFAAAAFISSRRTKTADDFSVAGRSAGLVSLIGVQLGTLVGAASTMGTVQTGYNAGLTAWWYTIGSGLGILILGLVLSRTLRAAKVSTLVGFIEREYGRGTAMLTTFGTVVGSLFSVTTQFLAGQALLMSMFPISDLSAAAILAAMMIVFIFTGGIKSFSSVGSLKTVMLFVMLGACAVAAASRGLGPSALIDALPSQPWFDIFSDGVPAGLSHCIAITTGVLSTQIYIQSICSAKDDRAAAASCVISCVTVVGMGLVCVMLGLALRASGAEIDSARSLPFFLTENFPPAVSGIFFGVLAITLVGGASGVALGVATNIAHDIVPRLSKIDEHDPRLLAVNRCSVIAVIALSAAIAMTLGGTHILTLSYAALGLRGASMFVPFIAAAAKPGLFSPRAAFASSAAGLAAMSISWAADLPVEPLLAGLAASLVAISAVGRRRP